MTAETYEPPLTPVQVEQRLTGLLSRNWESYQELKAAEQIYEDRKATFEIAYAGALLETHKYEDQKGWSVARREAAATIATEKERVALAAATSVVKAARAKAAAVRTQVDIVRSIRLSVSTSMGLES